MITGVHHVGLACADPPAAAAFYAALAGASDDGDGILAARNIRIELYQASEPAAMGTPELYHPGVRHLCIQDFDCHKLAARLTGAGGRLIADPLDLGTGNLYAYARDAEGNLLEIEGLPYAPSDEPSWVGHIALVTRDMGAAVRFYADLLDARAKGPRKVGPSPEIDRMGGFSGIELDGAWIRAGNIAIELWHFRAPTSEHGPGRHRFDAPGFSHIAFECDDPDRAAARAETLGARPVDVRHGARPTPGAAAARFVRGPDDVVIEFVEMADPDRRLAGLEDCTVVARIEDGR